MKPYFYILITWFSWSALVAQASLGGVPPPEPPAGSRSSVMGPGGVPNNNPNLLLQAVKNTEQESQEALKVNYQNLDDSKGDFQKTQENQAGPLTILRKSSH